MSRSPLSFHAVRTEGGLLPHDMLQRIALEDKSLPGITPEAYFLQGDRIRDAVNRAWSRLTVAWRSFQADLAKLKETDPATATTRDRWLLPLFKELDYGRLSRATPVEIEGKTYAISHAWGKSPIHLLGCRVDLDTRDKQTGASPHGVLQDLLNRSDAHLWGFVSNGYVLRILRDHHSLTQQAYVEFDLQAIMEGEAFSEFLLLWLLCHQSRAEGDRPDACWLEKWFQTSRDEGVRALDQLRDGVKRAIEALGTGFLRHKANKPVLFHALEDHQLDKQDYYRELLRLIYRLIFLFVAEDRDALLRRETPEVVRARYDRFYATKRLRDLAEKRRGGPHGDLWQQLRLVMGKLWDGSPELGLPALGSFLWSDRATAHLNGLELANEDLLEALRALCYVEQGKTRYAVSWRNIGAEELGSVYESLLELHPEIHKEAARFELTTAAGHERKTTGSYYTPTSLVDCLLDSALDPVLEEAAKKPDPEKAILDLKVCDPACGSGHFLVAAARRIAVRLAGVRSGGEEPSPPEVQRALRDVVGRCIYGVDLNPMAVELCKVSLWMEAIEPGKPLSFLESHIQAGNALLGATPALMAKGIPDEAFDPIEGDDKEVAKRLKKRNKKARETGQGTLFAGFAQGAPESYYGRITTAAGRVEEDRDDNIVAVRKKEQDWEQLTGSADYEKAKFLANAWCAAFVWPKQKGLLEDAAITEDLWRRMERDPAAAPPVTIREVGKIEQDYSLLHWHLSFPQVFFARGENDKDREQTTGWSGGFDVVLGNPPWERVKLQEIEFFSERNDAIARAPNAAARKRLIADLSRADPPLWAAWCSALREAAGRSQLARNSGRYPSCGRGDINTYALFAELNVSLVGGRGASGFIVPLGIASDATTSGFFVNLMESRRLRSLFGFENEGKLFEGIDHRVNFCLFTVTGSQREVDAEFAAFLRSPAQLEESGRRYTLTLDDLVLLNPNNRTSPVFRSARDAGLTRDIHRRVGVLWRETAPEGNAWKLALAAMFHMANDSHLFRSYPRTTSTDRGLQEWSDDAAPWLPLYEAKMVYHFNHRFGDFALVPPGERDHILPAPSDDQLSLASYVTSPRYLVPRAEVDARLREIWARDWLLGWRDVTDARSSARTLIACVIPRAGVGDTLLLAMPDCRPPRIACMYANLCAFALDYVARQKIAGVHLKFHVLKQLPVLAPSTYEPSSAWSSPNSLEAWLLARIMELTYTTWDLHPFAKDCGYDGPPFRWMEPRRFLLRCELDAAFFHLYGIARDDVDYVMETFPIVKRKDIAAHGDFRTKLTILEIYDRMQRSIDRGTQYQTVLDPPPADPRVAHPPRPTS